MVKSLDDSSLLNDSVTEILKLKIKNKKVDLLVLWQH